VWIERIAMGLLLRDGVVVKNIGAFDGSCETTFGAVFG
jgi:hypothetical protein